MAVFRSLWRLLPRSIRDTPADLVAVIAVVLATNLAVFAPVVRETAIRVPLGLVFVSFVPGYALIAALFPDRGTKVDDESVSADGGSSSGDWRRALPMRGPITGPERLVLSLASSVAIVPLLGLGLHFAPIPIRLSSIAAVLSATTVGMTIVAAGRRRSVPPSERFRVPYRRWLASARSGSLAGDSRANTALNVLIATMLVLSVGGVGYALVAPQDGERFTEVAVVTESDDGDTAAGGYSSAVDGDRNLTVTLENHEHQSVDYTVVVLEQRIASDDGNATVSERTELQRFGTRLDHGETWSRSHALEPTLTDTDDTVRVAWLVYADGTVPTTPTLENADYATHLWLEGTDE